MPTVVHFDLSADDVERVQKFYSEAFGWKFTQVPGPTPVESIYLIYHLWGPSCPNVVPGYVSS